MWQILKLLDSSNNNIKPILPFSQREFFFTLSWRRSLTYKKRSIDLFCKSTEWFLYDMGLLHERVESLGKISFPHWHKNTDNLLHLQLHGSLHYRKGCLHSLKLAKFVLFWIAEIAIQINLVNQKIPEMNFILLHL